MYANHTTAARKLTNDGFTINRSIVPSYWTHRDGRTAQIDRDTRGMRQAVVYKVRIYQ